MVLYDHRNTTAINELEISIKAYSFIKIPIKENGVATREGKTRDNHNDSITHVSAKRTPRTPSDQD